MYKQYERKNTYINGDKKFNKFPNPDWVWPLTMIVRYIFNDCLHSKTGRLMNVEKLASHVNET